MTAPILMIVPTTCPFCRAEATVHVTVEGYTAWKAGQLIQHAFPDLSPADRERLLTGLCPSCWDEATKEEP